MAWASGAWATGSWAVGAWAGCDVGGSTAGTATLSESSFGSVRKITFSWLSGTSTQVGTVTATSVELYDGELLGVRTIPGAGAEAPADNYDVALLDDAGHDLMLGSGLNRDTVNTEHINASSLSVVPPGRITLSISGAGSANRGTVIVWMR